MSQESNGTNETNDAAPAAPATPEDRIAALEAERDELKDRWLRLAAEFENSKKRARAAETDAKASGREDVLRQVLDIADNLERAVANVGAPGPGGAPDAAAIQKGVELVLRVLQQKLEKFEVRPFESKGQPFDPRVHEAISRVESDVPAGAVAVELQKGYRVGEKLLRPAMVSVSSGPAGKTSTGAAE